MEHDGEPQRIALRLKGLRTGARRTAPACALLPTAAALRCRRRSRRARAGFTAGELFGKGYSYTYDDVILHPGHIYFGAHEVRPRPPGGGRSSPKRRRAPAACARARQQAAPAPHAAAGPQAAACERQNRAARASVADSRHRPATACPVPRRPPHVRAHVTLR